MKSKKYTLKSFSEDAKKIVEKYTGVIPGWTLDVSARYYTDFSSEKTKYFVTYENKENLSLEFRLFGYGHSPKSALISFEQDFETLFNIYYVSEDIEL